MAGNIIKIHIVFMQSIIHFELICEIVFEVIGVVRIHTEIADRLRTHEQERNSRKMRGLAGPGCSPA